MIRYDDRFCWQGWGGRLHLASGCCRMRIVDLTDEPAARKVALLRPVMVVASDLPNSGPQLRRISVRSCASHIATCVVEQFGLDPRRMLFVEYRPASRYGPGGSHQVAESYEAAEFTWHGNRAMQATWRPLTDNERQLLSRWMTGFDPTESAG